MRTQLFNMANMFYRFIFILSGLLIPFSAFCQSYTAKDSTLQKPWLYLSAGAYNPNIVTSLRIDSDNGLGTDISLEDDLKFNSNIWVFKADAILQVSKRSQVAVMFTTLQRSKDLQLQGDVTFGDTTFYADAYVDVYFDTYYYAATWRYSIFNKPGWNAGFSIGLRTLQFKAGLYASASLNQNSYDYRKDAKFTAPAILVGLHGAGYLTDRLLARYSIEYFQASIADIKINVLETKASVEYYIIKNAGIGAAYNSNIYLVRELPFSDNIDGKVKFIFGGFNLFLTARF